MRSQAILFALCRGGVSSQETLGQSYEGTSSKKVSFSTMQAIQMDQLQRTLYTLCWDTVDLRLYSFAQPQAHQAPQSGRWTYILGTMTNGQVVIGSTGVTPVRSTLTTGTNISIVNTAGTNHNLCNRLWRFHLDACYRYDSDDGIRTMGYIADNAGLVTLALPATSTIGDEIQIIRTWRWWMGCFTSSISCKSLLVQAARQQVWVVSIASTNRRDAVYLVLYRCESLRWTAATGVQGNITIV